MKCQIRFSFVIKLVSFGDMMMGVHDVDGATKSSRGFNNQV